MGQIFGLFKCTYFMDGSEEKKIETAFSNNLIVYFTNYKKIIETASE